MKEWQEVIVLVGVVGIFGLLVAIQLTVSEEKIAYCKEFGYKTLDRQEILSENIFLKQQDKNNSANCAKLLYEADKNVYFYKRAAELKLVCNCGNDLK